MRKTLSPHVVVVTPLRVLRRWAADNEIPVQNKDTGRVVYVLPETLEEEPDRFKDLSPNEEPGNKVPKPTVRRPRKPRRPRVPKDPPPAPIRPPRPPKERKPPKFPEPVPQLRYPKVPEPSPFKEWTTEKRFQASRVAWKFMNQA